MTPIQHIVLNCTNRKRTQVAPGPRLREVPKGDIRERANAWTAAVADAHPSSTARDLYLGEYWRAGLNLARAAADRGRTSVSVISAGLGLIHADQRVPSYGATFARRHPDSVCAQQSERPSTIRRLWWDQLASWPGPAGAKGPRSLTELAGTAGARVLVCVGSDYLDAVADDLRAAHKVLGDDRLVVFASGAPLDGLTEVWARCPGQLRMRVGGPMASTGVRVARAVLTSLGRGDSLDARVATQRIAGLLRDADPLPQFDRARMSDEELIAWIVEDAKSHLGSRNKSAAIRRLRGSGRACEQGRFGELYDRTVESDQ